MMDYILHLDQYLLELIPVWGNYIYFVIGLVIFMESACILTPFLPGDGLLFILGLFSARNLLDPASIVTIVFLSTLIGYGINYYLGCYLGAKLMPWLKRRGFKKSLEDTQTYYYRYGIAAIVLGRFIPMVRTFIPLITGFLNLSQLRFWTANLTGATLWVMILMGGGWIAGKIGMLSSNISVVVFMIMLISILPIAMEMIRLMWRKYV